MRRKDREIKEIAAFHDIFKQTKICSMGLIDPQNLPYVVTLSYGYQQVDDHFEFYFHSAAQGKKIECLKLNHNVCLSFVGGQTIEGEDKEACTYTARYSSIVAQGEVEFIEDYDEKLVALKALMKHQTGEDHFNYDTRSVQHVTVFKVISQSISGKQSIA